MTNFLYCIKYKSLCWAAQSYSLLWLYIYMCSYYYISRYLEIILLDIRTDTEFNILPNTGYQDIISDWMPVIRSNILPYIWPKAEWQIFIPAGYPANPYLHRLSKKIDWDKLPHVAPICLPNPQVEMFPGVHYTVSNCYIMGMFYIDWLCSIVMLCSVQIQIETTQKWIKGAGVLTPLIN